MKLSLLTYGFALLGAMPIALSSPATSSVGSDSILGPDGLAEMDIIATTGSTGSSGPPLPTCGTLLEEITYGPLIVSEFLSDVCKTNHPDKPYLQQRVVKIKRIYDRGYTWECPRYAFNGAVCAPYVTTPCPDSTCIK